ncbi:MAG: hypothetical protein QM571_01805 [Micrococcaceae bacterium]
MTLTGEGLFELGNGVFSNTATVNIVDRVVTVGGTGNDVGFIIKPLANWAH